MKIALIADDLTGANDTGVQFARSGLKTSVLMQREDVSLSDLDVVVMDTDSRSVSSADAYDRVRRASEFLNRFSFDLIYKKVDSTMRGNVGRELDAVYDVFQPDFVLMAPAYPKNQRKVRDGNLYVGQKLLHETEIAHDPKTPVNESFIPDILSKGTKRKMGVITNGDLAQGKDFIKEKLALYYDENIPYIVFDSTTEEDLAQIVECVKETPFHVVWSGSAGLANYLTSCGQRKNHVFNVEQLDQEKSILMVIGSVNIHSRQQLERVLKEPSTIGIKLSSHLVVRDEKSLNNEMARVLRRVEEAIQQNLNIVLFSSGDKEEIHLANHSGSEYGLTPKMVSDQISHTLGLLTAKIVSEFQIRRLFLTGGDTAKKACISMGVPDFRLIDEVEIGIPIGKLVCKGETILTITKAGGFGSQDALVQSLRILRGEEETCVQ
ncbi:four-carbon acid sugar kinase family protein [Alkalihalobacillus sp. MEB130]|uniref:four-carbon acid sugar kinase family protein n=1 Tax=Alkalihalobacillus sp. MEB130 TaxID=2976704 RepID=UPI0028E073F3|nr:four-carbon acid sugar kinase family protein [Alkalihalobacillus sp. MEB130]MDT8858911.1 four-carbon acid sugar kinase family protein [Alkalihalobacillus sp. MEB130]